jgi:hypothetical protein
MLSVVLHTVCFGFAVAFGLCALRREVPTSNHLLLDWARSAGEGIAFSACACVWILELHTRPEWATMIVLFAALMLRRIVRALRGPYDARPVGRVLVLSWMCGLVVAVAAVDVLLSRSVESLLHAADLLLLPDVLAVFDGQMKSNAALPVLAFAFLAASVLPQVLIVFPACFRARSDEDAQTRDAWILALAFQAGVAVALGEQFELLRHRLLLRDLFSGLIGVQVALLTVSVTACWWASKRAQQQQREQHEQRDDDDE